MLRHVLLGKMLRCEHGRMLDVLVELSHALGKADLPMVRRLIAAFIELAGPHLRFEEDSLFPAMAPILGEECIEQHLSEHDRLIACALKLEELGHLDAVSDSRCREALQHVHLLRRDVTACDRLPSRIVDLSDDAAGSVLEAHDQAWQEKINLVHWSEWMRQRPVPPAPNLPTMMK